MNDINISFKPLSEDDLTRLHSWFQLPHVLQWYARGEHFSYEMIKEKYLPRIEEPASIPNFIVYADNQPIGYIQLYNVNNSLPDGISDYNHSLFSHFKPNEVAGIDFFIADISYLGKGYASLALRYFIDRHVSRQFSVLIIDPLKSNQQAIQFFTRNGFEKLNEEVTDSNNELMILIIK